MYLYGYEVICKMVLMSANCVSKRVQTQTSQTSYKPILTHILLQVVFSVCSISVLRTTEQETIL